jgi:hypothetical protein
MVSGVVLANNKDKQNRDKEGEVLKIFNRARIYVVTNDDAHLADAFLENAPYKERRVLTVAEWNRMPNGIRRFVSVVFLINRQFLPLASRIPESCDAANDELYTHVTRLGSEGGVSYEVVLSAPDSAWLRQAITDFRRLKEAPRKPQKRNVRSLAIVPIGAEAARAATPLLEVKEEKTNTRAHLLPAMNYPRASLRLVDMDELFLIDRSAVNDPSFAGLLSLTGDGQEIGQTDTAIWRERKPNGRFRVFISAPNGDHITHALQQYPNPLTAPTVVTVLHSARDLRAVRRVAVAAIKTGENSELARRLATIAATNLRSLEAFEVLERAGLSEILGEVALGQAGITQAADRNRIQKLAAADALFLVEITHINGQTTYRADHKRLTGRMGGAPRRPLEPSRLKMSIGDDPIVRVLAESLLKRTIGTRSDREYREALNTYNSEILPNWQRQMEQYDYEKRNRVVEWEQKTIAKTQATITGSLRLVDLRDGLVLWETPFSATDSWERPGEVTTVISRGEDSKPGEAEVPEPTHSIPESLLTQVTDKALVDGIRSLRGTALLPSVAPLTVVNAKGGTPIRVTTSNEVTGRILDLDSDLVLIGLGESDGVQLNDTLIVTLSDGTTVALKVTRVRPRTCDATFTEDVSVAVRTKVTAGMAVTRSSPTSTVPAKGSMEEPK